MTIQILLTGFGASEGDPTGISFEIARRAGSEKMVGTRVRALELPNDPDVSLLKAVETVDLHLPDAVIVLGAAPGARIFSVERVARNRDGASMSGLLDPSGPEMIECTIPVDRLVRRMRDAGVRAEASDSAPLWWTNRLAYALLRYVDLRGAETWFHRRPPADLVSRIGTLHVPSYGTSADRDEPAEGEEREYAVEKSVRAVRLALEEIVSPI